MIQQHLESFEANGWDVVPVGLKEAERHPKFGEYDKLDWLYDLSINPPDYTRTCYMRWLAYASVGLPFADLDVINFGVTPADAEPFFALEAPPIACGAHSVGFFAPAHYDQVLSAFDEAIGKIEFWKNKADDVNDMTLLKVQRPEWRARQLTFGLLTVRDYLRRGWQSARLIHFPHSTTPLPRSAAIQKVLDARQGPNSKQ